MNYQFMLQIIEDGAIAFSERYDNAMDAVTAYNKCVDYGDSRIWREVLLIEPNGKTHAKVFEYPLVAVN